MGNRLSKIYTRTGDDGTTGLGDGSRVGEGFARVTAYGTVDEANSAIGVVLACDVPDDVRTLLTMVQHQMFDLGGELCIPGHSAIDDADIDRLETAARPLQRSAAAAEGFHPARRRRSRRGAAIWRAPSAAAPSAKRVTLSHHDAVRPRRSAISTASPTCCSCSRACWRETAATAKCSGTTSVANAQQ
jgi:cob(I)alamin adenosyltransferase